LPEKDLSHGVEVARGATYIFIQGFLSAALGVVYIVFLTRLLSPEEIGTFSLLTFVLGLVQTIGLLSLPSVSVKYIAQFLAEGNKEKARAVVTRILQVTVIISVAAFAIIFALSGWISSTNSSLIVQASAIQALAVASLFVLFFYQALGFLQGLQKLRDVAIINLLYTVIQYGLALALVYLGFGVLGIIISWVVAFAVCSVLALAPTKRSLGIFGKPYELKPLLNFAFPLYVSGIFSFLVTWVDQLFILPYTGLGTFGMYNIANRAAVVPGLISSALVAALYPKLSQLYTESGRSSLENAFTATTRYVVFVGFPIILLVAVLAYPIIVLFAGVQYAPAAFPLAMLCVATLFGTIGVAITPAFYTLERTWTASLPAFASVVADALFSYVLIAFFGMGMIGASIAKIIAAAVGFILGVILLRQFIRVKFDMEMLWKVTLACGIMIIALLGFDVLRQIAIGPPNSFLEFRLLLLPVYIIFGIIVYCFAIIALRAIKKEDIDLFREYLPAKLKWTVGLIERLNLLPRITTDEFLTETATYIILAVISIFGALVQTLWWFLPGGIFILLLIIASIEHRRKKLKWKNC
jgi:stage V sporulation protein B